MFGLLLRTGNFESRQSKAELQTQTQMVPLIHAAGIFCFLYPQWAPIQSNFGFHFSARDSSFNLEWPRENYKFSVSLGMHLLTWYSTYKAQMKTVEITRRLVRNQCLEKSPVWLACVLGAMCSSVSFNGSAYF